MVTQLPLLVTTLIMLQRFPPQMHGKASLDLGMPLSGSDPIPYEVPEGARPRWQLKGRHAVFATPVPKGTTRLSRGGSGARATRSQVKANADKRPSAILDQLFYKLCWRDERRTSEAHIISTARERALHYLPNPEYVTEHVPEVLASREYDHFSTRHIRNSLGLDATGSRTPACMVMKKLQPFDGLEPERFRDAIWQISRCEWYFLYQQNTPLIS